MIRKVSLTVFILFVIAGAALAQTATPDPAPPTPQAITPAVPFQATTSPATVVPSIDDSRLAACVAPNLPNFLPYTVRASNATLEDLLLGSNLVTPVQLATLNCLDSTTDLPWGTTLFLPNDTLVAQLQSLSFFANEGGVPAVLENFSASALSVANDQGVSLRWEGSGQGARLYWCYVGEEDCFQQLRDAVLPRGTVTVNHFSQPGEITFTLEIFGSPDSSNTLESESVTIEVTCAQVWLGEVGASPRCPEDPPRTVTAVWQPFQGGVMMWFSDTRQIYVMTNADGRVRVFRDSFVDGMAYPDAVAPQELFTPIRGFGQVWEVLGAESSPLGWAMAQEIGFDSARQPAGRTSYTTYIQGPGETVYAITEVPGLDMGYWTQVAG